MKLHIAIDAKRLFLNASGLGRYSRTLIDGFLDPKFDSDVEFTLFKPKGETRFPAPEHPRVRVEEARYRMPGDLGNGWWRFHTLPKLIDSQAFSLFHGPSHVLPVSAKSPMVVTMFDLIFLRYPEYFRTWDRNYYKYAFKKSAQRADHIISFSKATRKDLIDFFGIEEEKITVVYPGFDDEFTPLPTDKLEDIKKKYQLPDTFVLYVGTIEPRKNISRTAIAFDRLLSSGKIDKNVEFLVVGSKGWFYKDILKTIQSLPAKNNIRLVGPVFGNDLAGIYQLARVMAYPSLFEGFGYPVLEAMRLGTPVLTSNVSSLPEAGGDAAILINPLKTDEIAEGLEKLIVDENQRRQAIEKGYRHAATFSPEAMARQTLDIYRAVAR